MYGPVDSSATHASSSSALQRQLGELELCLLMVPAEPTGGIWLGTARDLYCVELADLRQKVNELYVLMTSTTAQFQALAMAQ